MKASTVFSDAIAQLEAQWGSLRSTWTVDDWKRVAETLERALLVAGRLLDKSRETTSKNIEAIELLRDPPKKKLGRKPKPKVAIGGMSRIQIAQPLSRRHENFKKTTKFDKLTQMCLVAAVSREKGETDKEKLEALIGRMNPAWRKTRVATAVKDRWASRLSKAKKNLSDKDRKEISKWLKMNT